eukprot:scaffold4531_cov103-Cylindrotheca_fusiformis.AAC.9
MQCERRRDLVGLSYLKTEQILDKKYDARAEGMIQLIPTIVVSLMADRASSSMSTAAMPGNYA